jgi:MFS transporter, AAHS family, 4-hydroxybenzoate transporter
MWWRRPRIGVIVVAEAGGAAGALLIGGLLDRRGIIAVVLSFALAIPFVLAIGAVGMPEFLLMSVVFMSGLFLLGGQIALNALAGTLYPTFIRSTGAGWAFGIGRIGSILGPLIWSSVSLPCQWMEPLRCRPR